MISLGSTRARISALLTATLTATTLAATTPIANAAEGDTAPVLTAISLASVSDVTPGDTVRFTYAVSEDSGSIASMHIMMLDTAGRQVYLDLGKDLPATGESSAVIPEGVGNKQLSLAAVRLTDVTGHLVTYLSTGEVHCYPSCSPGSHGVDFSSTQLQVTGSTPDTTSPVITGLSLASTKVAAGDQARLDVAIDEAHPQTVLNRQLISATLTDAYHERFVLYGSTDAYGTLTATVPSTIPKGDYWIETITLVDRVGNRVYYGTSPEGAGWISKTPAGSIGPTTHSLPFKTTLLTVTDSPADGDSPILSGLTYPAGHLESGATGRISYSVTEHALESVSIEYDPTNGAQSPFGWNLVAQVDGSGTASGTVPTVSTGGWGVDAVRLQDASGNWSNYRRDGILECNRACPEKHTLDIAQLDVQVIAKPSAPSYVRATPRNGSARLEWGFPTDNGNSNIAGYTVTVSPGGKTYSTGGYALTVPGLTNNVAYSFAVRARNAAGTGAARTGATTPRALNRLAIIGDIDYDGRADIIGVNKKNEAYVYRGNGRGGISGYGTRVKSWLSDLRVLMPATAKPTEDFFGGNLLGVTYDSYDGSWWAPRVTTLRQTHAFLTTKFTTWKHVVPTGDFTGNGSGDVLAVNDAGSLYLWSARPTTGTFYSPRKVSSGWQYFTTVVGVGDLDGDRRNDIVARKKDGTLWLYAGNGTGGFRYKKQIGTSTSWKSFAHLAGMGDFTGDKRNDLLALAPNGYLYVYKGNGKGGFTSRILVSKGFASFV